MVESPEVQSLTARLELLEQRVNEQADVLAEVTRITIDASARLRALVKSPLADAGNVVDQNERVILQVVYGTESYADYLDQCHDKPSKQTARVIEFVRGAERGSLYN